LSEGRGFRHVQASFTKVDPEPNQMRNQTKLLRGYDQKLLVEMLCRMMLIRAFDSRLPGLSKQMLIRGSSHSSVGQEAVAVGACFPLQISDYVTSTHRGHGHTIAKGASIRPMMAELLGRANGCCRGKGGSMHIADFSIGMLGANGIVGGGIGIATGAALSAAISHSKRVALCFFGEGAINQGILLECGNMAALWKLPLVLLCENNQFSMSTRPQNVTSTIDLSLRAEGLGIPGSTVDGMDVLAVFDAVSTAVERARSGAGPSFIEARCYRFDGHFGGDGLEYRSKKELAVWQAKDPISSWRSRLIKAGLITDDEANEFAQQAGVLVDEAVELAKASPLPDPAAAKEDLYA
jgi:TPP-dependent pyruvate/acetoin dehydrogenase alpha subunit